MTVKWHDMTWPGKRPKFNLPHLRPISTGVKMAVLTPKSGITRHLPIILSIRHSGVIFR